MSSDEDDNSCGGDDIDSYNSSVNIYMTLVYVLLLNCLRIQWQKETLLLGHHFGWHPKSYR